MKSFKILYGIEAHILYWTLHIGGWPHWQVLVARGVNANTQQSSFHSTRWSKIYMFLSFFHPIEKRHFCKMIKQIQSPYFKNLPQKALQCLRNILYKNSVDWLFDFAKLFPPLWFANKSRSGKKVTAGEILLNWSIKVITPWLRLCSLPDDHTITFCLSMPTF